MIVDTSALIAILLGEPGWETLRRALESGPRNVPAPVITELQLVTGRRGGGDPERAKALLDALFADGVEVASFERRHAEMTSAAREQYGKGNGRGGLLNFGDLMVYAVAKDKGEPLLCTGQDFTTTDLEIHPASRLI